MTVSTSTNSVTYVATGATNIFDYDFVVYDESHFVVTLDGVGVTSGFTITGLGDEAGGTVVFDTNPTGTLVILRQVPFTQDIDYSPYDPFPAETHERGLDLGVMRDQQLKTDVDALATIVDGLVDQSDFGASVTAKEALRRSYAEAGYTLVSGSFEKGGTLVNTNDVLLHIAEGKAYSWGGALPKIVAAGSAPTPLGSGGWIDRSRVALRSELAAPSGADIVGFQQAGSGSVYRSVQDKLREVVSVKDFGAVGDGVADDTTAIQNAINCVGTNGTVFFPDGEYRVSSTLHLSNDQVWLQGELNARIKRYGAFEILRIDGSYNKVSNLQFMGNKATYPFPSFPRAALVLVTGDFNIITDNQIEDGNSHGILFRTAGAPQFNLVEGNIVLNCEEVGIAHDGGVDNRILGNHVSGCGFEGITLDQQSVRCVVDGNRINANCLNGGVGGIGVDWTDLCVISNNIITASGTLSGITFQNNLGPSNQNVISGNVFVDNPGYGVWLKQQPANFLLYSEEFDNGAWTTGNSTIKANATTAPDGATTADKLVENTANTNHNVQQNTRSYVAGQPYTASVYVKAAGRSKIELWFPGTIFPTNRSAIFDLSGSGSAVHSGTGTASIQLVGSGWYRCSFTLTCASSGTGYGCAINLNNGSTITYTGDGVSGVFIWGAMLSEGPFSAYSKTTNTQSYYTCNDNVITGNMFGASGSIKIDNDCQRNILSGNLYAAFPDVHPNSYCRVDNALVNFYAQNTVTRSNVTGDGTAYKVPYNKIIQDRNIASTSSFDTSTGVFTAPITANYTFSAGVLTQSSLGGLADSLLVEIVTSAGTFTQTFIATDQDVFGGSVTASFFLKRGETAFVRVVVFGGSKTYSVTDNINANYFTGVLIG